MAEPKSRFIKTVTFGGYDRTDVDKRLEALYSQIFDLKNELAESRLALDKVKKGDDAEKALEYSLAVERGKVTENQVKNQTISDKLKRVEEDNRQLENEIADLREETEKLKDSLEKVNIELNAFKSGDDTSALSAVFIEAQKSKDLIIKDAQQTADTLKKDSEKLAENIIADADNKAAMIIHEAEMRAAEISADALNKSEQMRVASQNLKASMLQETMKIGEQISFLKQAMEFFQSEGFDKINESEQLVKNTEAELKRDGVPVFAIPEEIQPKYPEAPKLNEVDFSPANNAKEEESKKRSAELDRLQSMAESIGAEKQDSPKQDNNSGKKMSLADLAKQADALGGSDNKSDSKKEDNNSGKKMSLADLAKQADALGGSDNKGDSKKSDNNSGKKMSLADLAKQADALGGSDNKGNSKKTDNNSGKKMNLADLAKQAAALGNAPEKNENKPKSGVNVSYMAKEADAIVGEKAKSREADRVKLADLVKQAEALTEDD